MGTHRSRLILLAAGAAAVTMAAAPPAAAEAGGGGPLGLRVGSLTLLQCPAAPGAWCGTLPVPFDRSDPTAGRLDIGFLWYPATASGPVQGTIVATEGGPGFPSSGTRDQYLPLFAPLLSHRNLLLVDNRGTGMSGAIQCPSLDSFGGVQPSEVFIDAVRRCGDLLNHQHRRPDGSWLHGADLYGTANAARDLADVLTSLQTGPVDLYGDSYGTWFSQTFASRFPGMLRSITLDASYQVLDLSPWYVSTATVTRVAVQATCLRSLACRDRGDGAVWARIGELAARVRAHPVDGRVVDNAGQLTAVHVDIRALVNVINDAGIDAGVYRELDGAARALLEHGDATPLLRLTVQTLQFDNGGSTDPTVFSNGLYMAVACTDYPQLFDMHSNPSQRRAQLAAQVARLPSDTFSPFSTAEWMSMDEYTEAFRSCLEWPAPVHSDPPITKRPPLVPATLPVLVLGGDIDTLTPSLRGGRVVARQMGPSARFVSVPNTTHVTALLDSHNCASVLVRRFVAAPGGLQSLDASCTRHIPEVRMVGDFPQAFSAAAPAAPLPGSESSGDGLQAATVATATAGDALNRWNYVSVPAGTGLRGGSFTSSDANGTLTITLHASRWVEDASSGGTVSLNRTTGEVSARVRISTEHGGTGWLTIRWNTNQQRAEATVRGTFDGQTVEAVLPAP